MYHVLVPVDTNTERALEQATYLTRRPTNADAVRVTVLHVFPREDPPPEGRAEFESVSAGVSAVETLTDAGFVVEGRVRTGNVAAEIRSYTREHEVDEIVVGTRDQSGTAMGLIGSTSKQLVQSTDVPIVIVSG